MPNVVNSTPGLILFNQLIGTTTPGQSGPGRDGNEGILCILPKSSFTGASPSDCLCYI